MLIPPLSILPSLVCFSPYWLPFRSWSPLICSYPKGLCPCSSLCLDSLLPGVHNVHSHTAKSLFKYSLMMPSPLFNIPIVLCLLIPSPSFSPQHLPSGEPYNLLSICLLPPEFKFHKGREIYDYFIHCYTLSTYSKAYCEMPNKYVKLVNEYSLMKETRQVAKGGMELS